MWIFQELASETKKYDKKGCYNHVTVFTVQGMKPHADSGCACNTSPNNNAAPVFLPGAPWLAPLAGWSDLPFRLLCREFGAAVCCTEMVSAKGLMYKSPGTKDLLATHPDDAPLVVQLFGSEAPFMEAATRQLCEAGFTWFDCNMGCSVPKVTRTGAGAGMGRDVPNALAVAKAMLHAAGPGKVGFKLRLGWDEGHSSWADLARGLEQLGAGWLTLHPRTARQGFSGTARWDAVAELKRLVSIPVIASGDLFTAQDGVNCLAETGADTVMYARGALRNPAVFADHTRLMAAGDAGASERQNGQSGQSGHADQEATNRAVLARIRRHAELARQFSSEHTALLKMRTIVPRYARHLSNAKTLRQGVIGCRNWNDFDSLLEHFTSAQEGEA